MTRELKFRIYNKRTNVWIHGPGEEVSLFGEMILFGGFLKGISIDDIQHCLPLQFTGMLDKNKKEIYHGDIVKYKINEIVWTDTVEWQHYGWVLFCEDGLESGSMPLTHIPELEVVGNVFDNKDLLAKKI